MCRRLRSCCAKRPRKMRNSLKHRTPGIDVSTRTGLPRSSAS
jgi:hypothetical protein